MIETWTLEQFRDELSKYVNTQGNTYEALERFFFAFRFRLPKFPEGHVDPDEPEFIGFKKLVEKLVDVTQMRGSSWVFKNDRPDGKPYSETLAHLFLAIEPGSIPAVQAYKISEDTYFTSDGNHRIYAAYLRGLPVKIWFEDI